MLEKYIEKPEIVFARLRAGKWERLIDHSNKTLLFFEELKKRHHLDAILGRILNRMRFDGEPLTAQMKEKIMFYFDQAIIMHDLGKINPVFQVQIMKNNKISVSDEYTNSHHSLLSSLLYLDIFLKDTEQMPEEEKNFLNHILYSFAYCISRHHGSLGNLLDFEDGKVKELFYQKLTSLYKMVQQYPNYIQYYTGREQFLQSFPLEQLQDTENFRYHDAHEPFSFYILCKLLFSSIVTCDSLATQSYLQDQDFELYQLTKTDKELLRRGYEETELYQKILSYKTDPSNLSIEPINQLRSELFWAADAELMKNPDKGIYYLEAPTGSGKTNVSINLALRLLEKHEESQRFIYVFPFNTLVEQTKKTIEKIYKKELRSKFPLHVINSVSPIEQLAEQDEETQLDYESELTRHQMLQYPMTMTSHVNFFNYLFGTSRESNLGFIHLSNSVVILDEIQSYRNKIWAEITQFLHEFSECLNLKIIIMSATMPDLAMLLNKEVSFHPLLKERDTYFQHPLFKDRVKLHFDLLERIFDRNTLLETICAYLENYGRRRYLIEFIRKETARYFFDELTKRYPQKRILELTGDDNQFYRKLILTELSEKDKNTGEFIVNNVIIIATQVIEAGVDIDMDIGFKDISLLDSEEQFLGRINRSCLRDDCHAYFFNLDEAMKIYKDDFRLEKNLKYPEYQLMLQRKVFSEFYNLNITRLKSMETNDLYQFVRDLRFKKVYQLFRLIDSQTFTLFIPFVLKTENGTSIDGYQVWEEYKTLFQEKTLPYAEKKIRLSQLNQNMSYFTYSLFSNGRQTPPRYEELVGNLYFVSNGESYMDEDQETGMKKFNRKKYLGDSEGMFL